MGSFRIKRKGEKVMIELKEVPLKKMEKAKKRNNMDIPDSMRSRRSRKNNEINSRTG